MHVANNGYTYDRNLDVFPLYPLLVQLTANSVQWVIGGRDLGLVNYTSLLKLGAFAVNLGCFVVAADFLYSLSRKVLKDEYLAYKAALLFSVNPASVYFTVFYPEAVYAAATFAGLFYLEEKQENSLISVWSGICLALASLTKPNGIINAGFVIYGSMKTVATHSIKYVRAKVKKDKYSSSGKSNYSRHWLIRPPWASYFWSY